MSTAWSVDPVPGVHTKCVRKIFLVCHQVWLLGLLEVQKGRKSLMGPRRLPVRSRPQMENALQYRDSILENGRIPSKSKPIPEIRSEKECTVNGER